MKEQHGMYKVIGIVIGIAVIAMMILLLYIIFNNIPNTAIQGSAPSSSANLSFLYTTPIYYEKNSDNITSATAHNNSWLEFDGVNDEVSRTELPISIGENWSISGWFIWVNSSSKDTKTFISNGYDNLNRVRCGIKGSIPNFQCAIGNSSSGQYWSSTRTNSSIDLNQYNQWYHFVWLTNDNISVGNKGKLYLDGILQPIQDGNVGSGDATSFRISSASTPWNGAIDEVRIYNQSLTSSQVSEIYNSGRIANSSLPSDGLVLWYSFDEGTGTTVYDKSGNGNHGS